MGTSLKLLSLCFLIAAFGIAEATPREISQHRWAGVERTVAIGDLHGDYDNYMATLHAARVVDTRGKWAAGQAHLVQTGDIPDRGPDTKKIIEHMAGLARQARRNGGRVHNLIGNHEAMNVYGDLRYVTNEEFGAFATRRSNRIRDRYFNAVLKELESRDPDRFADLPENFREQWEASRPLGWVEHRQAWNPDWNPDGEMYQWVSGALAAVQVNDVIFVHGGISAQYCRDTLISMTRRAQAALKRSDPKELGILTDQYGPFWYRGLAGVAPEAPSETVDAILETHDATRIVIGHTPTGGFIWPRYGGRVVQIDTGISSAYGGHIAYLEITPEGLFAGYETGKIELTGDEAGIETFLEEVVRLLPGNDAAQEKLRALRANSDNASAIPPPAAPSGINGDGPTTPAMENAVPICGTRL